MDLKGRVISAFGWSVAIKIVFQIVTWAMTLVVIRILSPDDYGLMATSQIFINFMTGFADLGLGDALVQRETPSRAMVASAFGVLIVISVSLTLLLVLAAHPIAHWYADPRLAPLIQLSSLGFLFNGLTVLPRMHLTKSLRVRPMLLMELSSGLLGATTVIALAYSGYGVWALVLGWLATGLAKLVGLALLTAEYYVWPQFDLALLRPLYGYGIYRSLDYTAWVLFASSDLLIIGRLLGTSELGLYTVAMNFAAMPLNKIAPIINSIAFPAFAMVQAQPEHARFYVLKSIRIMAVLVVPVFFGLSATAPEIVDLVFGPHWTAAKPVLAVLALAITFRAILLLIPNYLQGIGDARAGFWCTAVGMLIFPPAFLIGCRWGILGVGSAWLAGYPVVFGVSALIAAWRGGLDVKMLLLAPLRPMLAGAVMLFAVAALRPALPQEFPEITRFALLVAAGAATYATIMLLAFRDHVEEILRLSGASRQLAARLGLAVGDGP
jgi:O-antigen/teichoic acid export membrane protein